MTRETKKAFNAAVKYFDKIGYGWDLLNIRMLKNTDMGDSFYYYFEFEFYDNVINECTTIPWNVLVSKEEY